MYVMYISSTDLKNIYVYINTKMFLKTLINLLGPEKQFRQNESIIISSIFTHFIQTNWHLFIEEQRILQHVT